MRLDALFLRKILVAFIVGASPSLIAFVSSVGPGGHYQFTKAALVTVGAGAIAAGIRAILVLLPGINLVPSDAISPIKAAPSATVTVTPIQPPPVTPPAP